jgi:hypothetical protein
MYSSLRSAMFLLVIVASCCACAHDQPPNRTLKSENGLIIWWTVASSDANANQIEISDDQGHAVAALRVLRHVREARRVSIYDVSARENLIAIAAVYQSKEGDRQVRPAASLLLFSFEGQLLSAFALEPSHVIRRLVLDDHAKILHLLIMRIAMLIQRQFRWWSNIRERVPCQGSCSRGTCSRFMLQIRGKAPQLAHPLWAMTPCCVVLASGFNGLRENFDK